MVSAPTSCLRTGRVRLSAGAALALVTGLLACGPDAHDPGAVAEPDERAVRIDDLDPPTALWSQVKELRADLAAPRHGSDGGGRTRLVLGQGEEARALAGSFGSWTIEYTAGPLGVARGGALYFMPEPFWGWSPPQDVEPRSAGFTRVETSAEGVELELDSLRTSRESGLLVITIGGRALAAGETLVIQYGVGTRGAQADRYAGEGSRLWLAVDGDGDGVRALVEDSPQVEILPGPPEKLVLTLTSVARPGETVRMRVAVLDALANAGVRASGRVEILDRPQGWDIADALELTPDDGGCGTLEFAAHEPGVLRLRARLVTPERTLVAVSNPLLIDPDARSVYWADLHGHTGLSDGTGTPEGYFRYARDVAALDVVALSDHDHFGVRFLDSNPTLWEEIQARNAEFHSPGRFVTVLGFEWTSWIHGHRHVLYFDESNELISSLDPATETPRQLWAQLAGREALTIAHHSSGRPIPTNWSFAPDPVLEPVTEISSVHGSSEAADAPSPVRGSRPGNYVRDVLERGVRLGFIGSGDSHDGHPGHPHLSPLSGYRPPPPGSVGSRGERLGTGGLAGVRAENLSRADVLAALRARDVYATSGPRILLSTELGGLPMGAAVPASSVEDSATLAIDVIGTAPLAEVVLVRSGGRRVVFEAAGEWELSLRPKLEGLRAGEYVYVRVLQDDLGCAWSSPHFIE